jgi:hypothetical protein
VSREASLGVGKVHVGLVRRARPEEHLFVSGEEVKRRGHSGRVELKEWG